MIAASSSSTPTPTVLQTGFRPFFLAAIAYAIVSMTQWTLQLYLDRGIALPTIDRSLWHGHEMVFGYALAVITGFLLTAVQNWTGDKTARGKLLFVLWLLWLAPRLFALSPSPQLLAAVLVCNTAFYALLIAALTRPLVRTRNHAQWGIVGKLVLLWLLDALFIAAAIGWLDSGLAGPVLLVAVYTVIGLVLVMAQRVLPFFIRNAIADKDNIRDYPFIPQLSLLGFLVFVVADVMAWKNVLLVSGIATAAVNVVRLWGWHDAEIWRKPLLWVLYTALLFIITGIVMRATAHLTHTLPSLGLHAMTYGGIGIVTVGMMARVSIGHTGRDVFDPPGGLGVVFLLLIGGAALRSLLPLVFMDDYFLLVLLSQLLWIGAFMLMLVYFTGILVSARVDGKSG